MPETTMKFNGAALRAWRTVRGLSGVKLAEDSGLKSQGYIASLESGRKQPSWGAVEALARALEIAPVVLVTSVDAANSETWPYRSGRRSDIKSAA
jgi:transcriptional regulator with XRE-family HTH domain